MPINIANAFSIEPSALDFVWPGFLAGTVGSLAAAGSTGKSFYALEAAMGVASGRADSVLLNLGIRRHGKAVILNAKDPEAVIVRRIHAIGAHLGEEARREVAANLVIEPLMGRRCNLQEKQWHDAVLIGAKDARLVVLNTISLWHRGIESDTGEMAGVLSLLDHVASETGAAVLFLHHVSHGLPLDERQGKQHVSRDASAIAANTRWQGFLQNMTDEDAKRLGVAPEGRKKYVAFGGNKENYGQHSDDAWLKRHEDGVLLPVKNGLW
jgi:RecA-family ATPase